MGDGLRSSSQDDVVASKKEALFCGSHAAAVLLEVLGPAVQGSRAGEYAADAAAGRGDGEQFGRGSRRRRRRRRGKSPRAARALSHYLPRTLQPPPAAPACRLTASRIARPPGWERASLRRSMAITKDITTLNYLRWGGKARHAPR